MTHIQTFSSVPPRWYHKWHQDLMCNLQWWIKISAKIDSSNIVATNTTPCGVSIHSKYSTSAKRHSGLDHTLPVYLGVLCADLLGVLNSHWFILSESLRHLLSGEKQLAERNILYYQAQSYRAERCNSIGDFQRSLVANGKFLAFILRRKPYRRARCTQRWAMYLDILVSEEETKGLWELNVSGFISVFYFYTWM